LTIEDIDGDGRILQMRVADPNGLWKRHPQRAADDGCREPAEVGGVLSIVAEGTIENTTGSP
jgi:hypothetical protein